jgi:hypothetical protein
MESQPCGNGGKRLPPLAFPARGDDRDADEYRGKDAEDQDWVEKERIHDFSDVR